MKHLNKAQLIELNTTLYKDNAYLREELRAARTRLATEGTVPSSGDADSSAAREGIPREHGDCEHARQVVGVLPAVPRRGSRTEGARDARELHAIRTRN